MLPKVLLIVIFACLSRIAFSQQVDYNKIVIPNSIVNINIEEKLVQLAWNNHPLNHIAASNIKIAKDQVKLEKWSWADQIMFVGNLNQFTLDPESDLFGRSAYYPKYNFSVRITLGNFINVPINTKIRNEQLIVSQSNLNAQKLAVRSKVLKLYQEFLMNLELLSIQTQILQDAEDNFRVTEEKFKNKEIEFSELNKTIIVLNQAKVDKIKIQKELKIAEINIEEMIGVPLQELL